jgi:hypothetical protein
LLGTASFFLKKNSKFISVLRRRFRCLVAAPFFSRATPPVSTRCAGLGTDLVVSMKRENLPPLGVSPEMGVVLHGEKYISPAIPQFQQALSVSRLILLLATTRHVSWLGGQSILPSIPSRAMVS